MRRILSIAVGSLAIAAAFPTTAQEAVIATDQGRSATTASVPAGINDRFKVPELNVDEWLERFEVESREVYGG